MKKLILILVCVAVGFGAMAQKPKKNFRAPVVLSVGDIMGNYGLDSAWVNDTAAAIRYLNEQPEDYVALTNLCVSIRTKAQKAIASIENDYEFRDSLIWLDSNTVLADYPIYEYRLRLLADLMGKMSIRYSRLEHGLFVGILLGIDRAAYVHRSDGCSRNAFGRDRWGIQQDTQTAFR